VVKFVVLPLEVRKTAFFCWNFQIPAPLFRHPHACV